MGNTAKDLSTEQKILAAAKKVFVRKGFAGARMQDIADEAGINKALLHYYFRKKDKLFEMIFAEAAERLFPRINLIFESDLPLFEKIERFTSEYIDTIRENEFLPLFVLNEMHQDPNYLIRKIWPETARPKPGKFLQQIQQEIARGNIREISPIQLLMHLVSLCIFPFVGKPMIQLNLGLDSFQFDSLMEQRKTEVSRFIIDAIRK